MCISHRQHLREFRSLNFDSSGTLEEGAVERSDGRKLWLRVWQLLKSDRFRLIASFCVVLAMVALNMASIVLLQRVVDVALPNRDTNLLAVLCSIMLVAAVTASACTVCMARLNHTIGQNLVHGLRKDMFRSTQRMPLEHFKSNSVAEFQTRLSSDIEGISNVLTFAVQGMVHSVATLVVSAVIMLIMSWPIALVTLTVSIALNILNNRYARKRRRFTGIRQAGMSNMVHFAGEHLSLSGVILGRTMDREHWQFNKFEGLSRQVRDVSIQERLAGRAAIATISMTMAILPILAYWVAGTILTDVSLGSVIVITALQAQISKPIQQLLQLSSDIQTSRVFFERIFQVLDQSGGGHRSVRHSEDDSPERIKGIFLQDVVFSYNGDGKPALASVSLTIPAGKRIFVTGESGSGKSTLALILAGLISPQSGSVGVQLSSGRSVEDLRSVVTLVPQDAALFNMSIRENLAFGDSSENTDQMIAVLRSMALTSLIDKIPGGLNGVVGDRGTKVSGGERQRLAVARSLLADYPVMVFDEFTSALDDVTSEVVFESLLASIKGKTLIVITHKLPSLREGDIVVTMYKGKVTEMVEWGVPQRFGGPDASSSLL
ncbi:ABC transporter ATP-binding protein [Streptomyces sp. IPPR8]|uniref:ABC transporter ATP-binding protein n=1 Tax=Streptomyces sp. IPPR8 TaxID=3417301 RepID=UPI003D68721E